MNTNTPITILGASGNIGKKLCSRLAQYRPFMPNREEMSQLEGKELGVVFYCIGKVSNFRVNAQETIDAHVNVLNKILTQCQFDKLIYCSSTRVYDGLTLDIASEESMLPVSSEDSHYVYQLSKLLGEWLCLNDPGKRAVVVRISNIYGLPGEITDGFLPHVLSELANGTKSLSLSALADGQRDYLFIDDLIDMLLMIANKKNHHRLYNIANGETISNIELFDFLSKKTGCEFSLNLDHRPIHLPTIETGRFVEEFQYRPPAFWQRLKELLDKMGLLAHSN